MNKNNILISILALLFLILANLIESSTFGKAGVAFILGATWMAIANHIRSTGNK